MEVAGVFMETPASFWQEKFDVTSVIYSSG